MGQQAPLADKLPIALSVFFLFGILYFPAAQPRRTPAARRERDTDGSAPDDNSSSPTQLLQLSVLAGLAPLVFGLSIAGQREYHDKWPLLLGYLGLLDAALIFVGAQRRQSFLALAASFATCFSVGLLLEAVRRLPKPLPGWGFAVDAGAGCSA